MKVIRTILVCMALTGCNKGEQEIVIIPPNYIGRIMIVYDQSDGTEPLYNNGKRVYTIPRNGILKTKMSPNPGWIGLPEFYYNSISASNRITFVPNRKALPLDSIVANGGTAGSVNNGKQVVRFLEYYVGNKAQIDSAYEKAQTLDLGRQLR